MFKGPRKDKKKSKAVKTKQAFVISEPPKDTRPDVQDPVVEFLETEKSFAESMAVFAQAMKNLDAPALLSLTKEKRDPREKEHPGEKVATKSVEKFLKFVDSCDRMLEGHQKFLDSYESSGFSEETIAIFENDFAPHLSQLAIQASTEIMTGKMDAILDKKELDKIIVKYEEAYAKQNVGYRPIKQVDSYTIKPMQHLTRYPMKLEQIIKLYRTLQSQNENESGVEYMKKRVNLMNSAKLAENMLDITGKVAMLTNAKMGELKSKPQNLSSSEEIAYVARKDLSKSVSFLQSSSQERAVATKSRKESDSKVSKEHQDTKQKQPKSPSIRRSQKKSLSESALEQPAQPRKDHPLLSGEGLVPLKRTSAILSVKSSKATVKPSENSPEQGSNGKKKKKSRFG